MPQHETLNYVEFPNRDLQTTAQFFTRVFGWSFEAYGSDYIAFSNAGLDGGFYRADLQARSERGSALLVFYSAGLEDTLAKVEAAGGTILKPVFDFPGGRRFHFAEPGGNEFAVWSDPVDWAGRACASRRCTRRCADQEAVSVRDPWVVKK